MQHPADRSVTASGPVDQPAPDRASSRGRRCGRLASVALGSVVFTAVSAGTARAEDALNGHQLDVAVETEFPIVVGLSTTWEHPSRFRIKLSGGFLPSSYIETTNSVLVSQEVFSQDVADIIEAALSNGMVLHARLGWRPLKRRGLVVYGGYQFLGLGGSTADLSLFGEASDPVLIAVGNDITGELDIGVSAHMLSAGAGYEWAVWKDRIVLGTSLSYSRTVAAPSHATPARTADGEFEQSVSDAVVDSSEDYLSYVFEEWVHLPLVGLSVGYRFR